MVRDGNDAEYKVEDIKVGNWAATLGQRRGVEKDGIHAKGFFKAPRTGDYRFFFTADDYGLVYFN